MPSNKSFQPTVSPPLRSGKPAAEAWRWTALDEERERCKR